MTIDTPIMNNREHLERIIESVVDCASEVHRHLGAGLSRALYEDALCYELEQNTIRYVRELSVPIIYKGHKLGKFRLDLLVEDAVIIEVNAIDRIKPVSEAQLSSYLKVVGKRAGVIINFTASSLRNEIKKIVR